MFNAWQALADDIMTFLISRGMRPSPHRYAVVSHLADHGVLDDQRVGVPIADGGATVNRAIYRRMVEILVREGVVERQESSDGDRYYLRPPEGWGTSPEAGEERTGDQHLAAAG
jgi:Fe2+ or Zn2+ uptake regulation protein